MTTVTLRARPVNDAAFSPRPSKYDAPFTPAERNLLSRPHIAREVARLHVLAERSTYFQTLESIDGEYANTLLARGLKQAAAGFRPDIICAHRGETLEQAQAKAFRTFAWKALFRDQLLSNHLRACKKIAEGKCLSLRGYGGEDSLGLAQSIDMRPDQQAEFNEAVAENAF